MKYNLQDALLTRILSHFNRKSEAVEKLSELLNVGRDAIYRRLRGDTLLSPEEICILSEAFGISLDEVAFGQSDLVFFTFNALSQKINTVEDYLGSVDENLSRLSQLPNAKIKYAATEIPIFYYCTFPEIISFKLYVWGRTIWDLNHIQQKPFHFDFLPPHVMEMGRRLLDNYTQLATTELWSLNLFDNTLNQIEYHVNNGSFAEEKDALLICDRLQELAEHLCFMAEKGRKFKQSQDPDLGPDFRLYHNEMLYTNNTIFLSSPSVRIVFSTFGNPNFIGSTDPRICDYTEDWFEKVISKSGAISMASERARNWYFKGIQKRISQTRSRIKLQIEGGY